MTSRAHLRLQLTTLCLFTYLLLLLPGTVHIIMFPCVFGEQASGVTGRSLDGVATGGQLSFAIYSPRNSLLAFGLGYLNSDVYLSLMS